MTVDSKTPTLVIGASGFVGNNLVRYLLQLGRTVRVLVRQPGKESLRGLNVESVLGDVLDPPSLQSAAAGVSSVFHLAASISIDGHHAQMRQVNEQGTANVVQACLNEGVERLVHFSSIHALSYLPKEQPINETRPLAVDPKIHLPYDQSKAAGEQQILEGIKRGLDAVILNPVGILGPFDFGPSPGGEFIRQLMHRNLPGLLQAGYYWVDVRDVSRAAVAAETKGRCGEKYLLFGQYATFKSIAQWIQEFSGARPPFFNFPMWMAKAVAPMVAWYCCRRGIKPLMTPDAIQIVECHQKISTSKAAQELGFQARSLRETIADTVHWLQAHELRGTNPTTDADQTI